MKTLAKLEAWEKKIPQGLSTRIEVETATIRRKFDPEVKLNSTELLVREIRESEIRRSLEGVDPAMLGLRYGSLGAEVREAIRHAPLRVVADKKGPPKSVPLVAQKVIDDFDAMAMAEDFPEETAEIQELQELRGTYENLARAIRGELGKIRAPPSVEELAAAAEAGE